MLQQGTQKGEGKAEPTQFSGLTTHWEDQVTTAYKMVG